MKTVKTVDSHSTIAYHPAEAGVLMRGEMEVDKAEMRAFQAFQGIKPGMTFLFLRLGISSPVA